jgi:hypothetical protein
MSDRDAYRNEMGSLRPRDIDDPDLSALVEEVRSAYLREPDPEVGSRHLAAIVEQAQAVSAAPTTGPSAERKPITRRLGLIARVGIAAAGFGLVTGGLALAGVNLPMLPDTASETASEAVAADRAQETKGPSEDVIVPSAEQLSDEASDTAVAVLETIEANLPLLQDGDISGCEFGAMVSAAARDVEPDTSHCRHGGPGAEAPGVSKGAGASAEGRARAEAAKAAGQAKGEAASGGKANAGGKSDDGAENLGGGKAKADEAKAAGQAKGEAASGGKAKADEAKAAGQAKGEAASGGKANPGGNNPND